MKPKIIGAMLLFTISYFTMSSQETPHFSDKSIQKSVIVNCSLDATWWKWTTHEGLKTFFGENNNIELVPGGPYEIYFSMLAPKGQKGGEGCTVLSYIPKRMLSFTWNAPPSFPDIRKAEEYTWVVVEFEALSERQTLVKLTHLGWREGKDWDGVYKYFEASWDTVMGWLRKSCEGE